MIPPRFLTWPRFVTLLLAVYWILLATATHVSTLPTRTVHYHDKTAHYIAYAGLAFLIAWAWRTRWNLYPKGLLLAFGLAVVYGALDELLQGLVPGRFADVYDWLADLVGTTTGVLLFWGIDALWKLMPRAEG